MVARGIELPNIRKIFIPDTGYVIVDMDLAGADAQVVAWEADDEDLKTAFRSGVKIHCHNLRAMFPEHANLTDAQIKNDKGEIYYLYDRNKRAVHGTNYVGTAAGIAQKIKWPVPQVQRFQERWFELHPGIKEWHNRVLRHLQGIECWNCRASSTGGARCESCGKALGRTVKNAFGYRIVYFDRVNDDMLRQAVAWIGQSTVAIVTRKALIILDEEFPDVDLLLQVHDSLVFQLPIENHEARIAEIKTRLDNIVVPYPDPLRIQWGAAFSPVSWGDA